MYWYLLFVSCLLGIKGSTVAVARRRVAQREKVGTRYSHRRLTDLRCMVAYLCSLLPGRMFLWRSVAIDCWRVSFFLNMPVSVCLYVAHGAFVHDFVLHVNSLV